MKSTIEATMLFVGQMDPKQMNELRKHIIESGIVGLDTKIITFHSNPYNVASFARSTSKPIFMIGHYWADLLKDIHYKEGNRLAQEIKNANPNALVYQYSHHEGRFSDYDGFVRKSAQRGGIDPAPFIEFIKGISFLNE